MALLDRSKLRLKAATAKLKKHVQCTMSGKKAQMEAGFSHKKAQKPQNEGLLSGPPHWTFKKFFFCPFVPFCG